MTVVFWILVAYALFFVFLAIVPEVAEQPSSRTNPYRPREALLEAPTETDEPPIVVGTDLAI